MLNSIVKFNYLKEVVHLLPKPKIDVPNNFRWDCTGANRDVEKYEDSEETVVLGPPGEHMYVVLREGTSSPSVNYHSFKNNYRINSESNFVM
eukprot:6489515-Amphidinium_carterae.1